MTFSPNSFGPKSMAIGSTPAKCACWHSASCWPAPTPHAAIGRLDAGLCDHPDQWALLRDQPDLGMNAVEETMRHSPSMCSTLRSVTEDVTVGEYTFPAGTFILVNTYAANRDPAIYDDPTRFDITRNDPPPILTSAAVPTTASARTWRDVNSPKHSRSLLTGCRTPGSSGRRPGGPARYERADQSAHRVRPRTRKLMTAKPPAYVGRIAGSVVAVAIGAAVMCGSRVALATPEGSAAAAGESTGGGCRRRSARVIRARRCATRT